MMWRPRSGAAQWRTGYEHGAGDSHTLRGTSRTRLASARQSIELQAAKRVAGAPGVTGHVTAGIDPRVLAAALTDEISVPHHDSAVLTDDIPPPAWRCPRSAASTSSVPTGLAGAGPPVRVAWPWRSLTGGTVRHMRGRGRLWLRTGGEPLLQIDAAAVEALHIIGFEAAVETSRAGRRGRGGRRPVRCAGR